MEFLDIKFLDIFQIFRASKTFFRHFSNNFSINYCQYFLNRAILTKSNVYLTVLNWKNGKFVDPFLENV